MKHVKLFEEIGDVRRMGLVPNNQESDSPKPYPRVEWDKRTAFNRDLTTELTDVCDRFLRHIDPEDIEQALIELSHKYGDMK